MGIHKFLDLNTAHLTKDDADMLTAYDPEGLLGSALPIIVRPHDYGWFIHVPHDDVTTVLNDCVKAAFSKHFVKILRHAAKRKCWWINFDSDGEFHHKFKKHVW